MRRKRVVETHRRHITTAGRQGRSVLSICRSGKRRIASFLFSFYLIFFFFFSTSFIREIFCWLVVLSFCFVISLCALTEPRDGRPMNQHQPSKVRRERREKGAHTRTHWETGTSDRKRPPCSQHARHRISNHFVIFCCFFQTPGISIPPTFFCFLSSVVVVVVVALREELLFVVLPDGACFTGNFFSPLFFFCLRNSFEVVHLRTLPSR